MSATGLHGRDVLSAAGRGYLVTLVVALVQYAMTAVRHEVAMGASIAQYDLVLQAAAAKIEPTLWSSANWRCWLFLTLIALTARWVASSSGLQRPLSAAAVLGLWMAFYRGGTVGDVPASWFFYFSTLAGIAFVGQRYDRHGRLVVLPVVAALALTVYDDQTLLDATVGGITVHAPYSYVLRLLDLLGHLVWIYAAIACHAWALSRSAPARLDDETPTTP